MFLRVRGLFGARRAAKVERESETELSVYTLFQTLFGKAHAPRKIAPDSALTKRCESDFGCPQSAAGQGLGSAYDFFGAACRGPLGRSMPSVVTFS